MRKNAIKSLSVVFLCFLWIGASELYAYNLRHISKKDGLSNSAILSMCQDSDGYMWFGSIGGLNRFDGITIQTYQPGNSRDALSGNLIESIVESEVGILWVQTNYGLNRFDSKRRSVKRYDGYISNYMLQTNALCELYFIKEGGLFTYFNARTDSFTEIPLPGVDYADMLDYCMDGNNVLWVFGRTSPVKTWQVTESPGGTLQLEPVTLFSHPRKLLFAAHEKDAAYLVDETGILYQYDLLDLRKSYVADISETIGHDEISAVIKHKNDYFVGYKATGLICLRHTPENLGYDNYVPEKIHISAGIFCLMNDRRQDIVWVGTDGKGVYAYSENRYSVRSFLFTGFLHHIKMPVRAIFLDDAKYLWLGTKGNGIVRIRNYDINTIPSVHNVDFINTSNSRLSDNSIYSIQRSVNGIIWIGSDGGLDYYDPRDGLIRKLPVVVGDDSIKFVHSVCEFDGNTLWIASMGDGVCRVELEWKNKRPSVLRIQRYLHARSMSADNYFYSAFRRGDGTMWFGNRGHGVFRYDAQRDVLRQVPFDIPNTNRTLNDIFCIFEDKEANLWFGTGCGLVRYSPGTGMGEVVYNADELSNNTVHGILSDRGGNIWVSTDLGVAMLNPAHRGICKFNELDDDQVMEFCNGAYFRDPESRMLFFGGINGFVTIKENNYRESEFIPGITFERLSIFGQGCNINDFIASPKHGGDPQTLFLKHDQNFFSISVATLDHINGSNYTFSYKLEGLNGNWINNGHSDNIHLTNLAPGNYTLRVKYRDNTTGRVSPDYLLDIRISPPWYGTAIAKIFYLLFSVGVVYMLALRIYRKQKARRDEELDRIERKHLKEVTESKLQFFTNIAHEFCTPLTLISGPCERILTHHVDNFVQQHVHLIQRNVTRMKDLIEDLIEFRRIETGNRLPKLEKVDISALINDIASDFDYLGEARKLDYIKTISPDICWCTDHEFIRVIVSNFISNAFKYVDTNGRIEINVCTEDSTLRIEVMNTGKGIKKEYINKIFDRYSILEDFENPSNNVMTRNGLGLAISHDMIKLLNGNIYVESTYGEYVVFTAMIPQGELAADDTQLLFSPAPIHIRDKGYLAGIEVPKYEFDRFKLTIMVVDDEPEMLWLLVDIFSEDYNVIPVRESSRVEEVFSKVLPDVIISDVKMPGTDGISLTKQIKANPNTSHIPLILISAKHMVEEQIEGIKAGAEIYISKPFDVNYLQTFVRQLILRKKQLKEYFSSPLSAYEFIGGKLTHIEHKRFAQQILDIINSNIHNPGLSVRMIAQQMGVSVRHLHRRMAEMELQSPAEMIRECKMHIACDLLQNSKFTIDEIVFKSGFSNPSSFFRTFSRKYGCTPSDWRQRSRVSI